MQITFDTTTITDDEVRGIFALLDTVRPAAFDPGPFSESDMERAVEEKLTPWKGVQITKRADTGEEVSREPVSTFDGEEFPQSPVPPTIDSTGLVWDERIHASSKALNADGTWRTKRGVDKALVAQVEAELRQTYISELDAANERVAELVGVEDAQTVAPPAPPAPVETPLVADGSYVETAPPAPEAPPAPSPTNAPAGVSPFVALMKRVTTAQGAGKLTQPRVKELLESMKKKSIMDLRTDEDALASFAVLLDGEGV